AQPLRRGAMRGGAVGTTVGYTDGEVNKLFRLRIERTRRHYLFQAFPGALQRRRVIGEGAPEIVDEVGVAAGSDVVGNGARPFACLFVAEQRYDCHVTSEPDVRRYRLAATPRRAGRPETASAYENRCTATSRDARRWPAGCARTPDGRTRPD